MEESKKSNIIIGLLVTILVILILIVVIFVPINVMHSSSFDTTAMSADMIKVDIVYTVKFKAPIIFPDEIRKDAERKIKIYADMRIAGFIAKERAIVLKDATLHTLQMGFDSEDVLGDIIRNLNIPNVSDKIDKIKSVRFNSLKFDTFFEDNIKKHNKAKQEADSLHNIMITLR
jgi:hypothetical protein